MNNEFNLDDSEIDPDYVEEERIPAWRYKQLYDASCSTFASLTKSFDLDDWRDCRTEHYWKSDNIIDRLKRIEYKIKLVQYYNAKGKPLA